MLSAINKDGKVVQLAGRHRHELLTVHKQDNFVCPECQEPVLIRAGTRVIPHFAHFPNSNCSLSKGGEGTYHQQGKIKLWEWLESQGYHAILEAYLPEIQQRPDILIRTKSRQIAIEYQCARIPETEIVKRTRLYESIGVFPFWILGGNRLVRKGSDLLQLSAFEKMFIYYHQDYRIHYYDPVTDQLMIGYHLQGSGSNLVFSSMKYFSLSDISLKNVFAIPNLPFNDMPAGWKSFIKKRRTRHPLHPSPQEKSWRQYLYAKGYHPSLLPSITYLPVPSQMQLTEPPWIWQSRYYLDTFLKTPVGGLLPLKPAQVIIPLLHGHMKPNPFKEYLEVLCLLGLVAEEQPGKYHKRKEAENPLTIEEAIIQDEIVFNSFKKRVKA